MPGASLLSLLDDIASILDDVAVLTKVAAKKTAGVVGDDLALNAEQVVGVQADRELPVVWAVAKGSFVNKLVLVPSALALSAVAPMVVTPLLMLGGAFLCFEGFEKVAHAAFRRKDPGSGSEPAAEVSEAEPRLDAAALEREKIRGAVRTDFVLSAEIIVIALGAAEGASLGTRAAVLSSVGVGMTIGVYGLVAAIVKLDDLGLHLSRRGGASKVVGRALLVGAPLLMKVLSVAGTAAMFSVGGQILSHGVHAIAERVASLVSSLSSGLQSAATFLLETLVGVIAGALLVLLVGGAKSVLRLVRKP